MVDRRKFLKGSVATAVAAGLPVGLGWTIRDAAAAQACDGEILGCGFFGLADPAWTWAKAFTHKVPDANAKGFIYKKTRSTYKLAVGPALHSAGLYKSSGSAQPPMPIYGYGEKVGRSYQFTWPGKTFEIAKGEDGVKVDWKNKLPASGSEHILPVDTSLHWAYALHGYHGKTIGNSGVPIITHLHGGHTDFQWDGNPEFFYNPDGSVIGPQWDTVPQGFSTVFRYDTDVPAGTLWYHDHALGITRLNVYAGMAGFFIVRDDIDSGEEGNRAGLPVRPYEKLYAIQDRMFTDDGKLFVPAFPGDPYYADFIGGEAIGGQLPMNKYFGNKGGPTAMAEFFGDHMIVNGMAWPKESVEPRNYRMRLLNGTDSRFMALKFHVADGSGKQVTGDPIPFHVIGADQGLASSPTEVTTLVSEPGSRYDVIFDFSGFNGKRIIMQNIGGDEPFGGDIGVGQVFEFTDRVMRFDVEETLSDVPDVSPVYRGNKAFQYKGTKGRTRRVRRVALFEGKDEYGRLQPLLGTVDPATDYRGKPVNYPKTGMYREAVLPDQDGGGGGTQHPLTGPMEGSIPWHSPTSENPAEDSTEEWEIWNMTGDGHPVHLHLVNFEVLGRREIVFDSNADEDGFLPRNGKAAGDGVYLEMQPTVQHNSKPGMADTYGIGFKISGNKDVKGPAVPQPDGYVENAPRDMVTALPGQVTRIKCTFDKPGRYVWHCHILSHEDHEMMRVLHVGDGA